MAAIDTIAGIAFLLSVAALVAWGLFVLCREYVRIVREDPRHNWPMGAALVAALSFIVLVISQAVR